MGKKGSAEESVTSTELEDFVESDFIKLLAEIIVEITIRQAYEKGNSLSEI